MITLRRRLWSKREFQSVQPLGGATEVESNIFDELDDELTADAKSVRK